MNKGRKPNTSACLRCRRLKRRCDQKLPKCSLCTASGADCVGYDAVTKKPVPRSYVRDLEKRVKTLEAALRDSGNSVHTPGDSPLDHRSSFPEQPSPSVPGPATPSMPESGVSDSHEAPGARRVGTGAAIANSPHQDSTASPAEAYLMDLIGARAAAQASDIVFSDRWLGDEGLSVDDIEPSSTTFAPRRSVQSLVEAYLHFSDQSLPLLYRPWLYQKLSTMYTGTASPDLMTASTEIRTAAFFVSEACAVALSVLQKYNPSRITTSMANRYHKIATKVLGDIGLPQGLEGVQALILLAQYSYHHPTKWSELRLVGTALRSAVHLGLHQDSPADQKIDALALDIRRRTFWAAYALERNLAISLGLPFCLADGAIATKLPSEQNDENITSSGISAADELTPKPKLLGLHLLRYRQLQSEMRTVLYESLPAALSLVTISLATWQQQMHQRIESWYNSTPHLQTMTDREKKNLENFEVNYYVALLYLYRPSPNIPILDEEGLLTLADVSTHVVETYRRFFVKKQLTLYWLAIENLFQAGTALMYASTKSSAVRGQITLKSLERSIHVCSSVLWGMVEHCPSFESKRDTFDEIVSNTLPELRQTTFNAANSDEATPRCASSMDLSEQGTGPFQQTATTEAQYQDLPNFFNGYRHTDYLQLNPPTNGMDFLDTSQLPSTSTHALDPSASEWDLLEQNPDFLIPGWL